MDGLEKRSRWKAPVSSGRPTVTDQSQLFQRCSYITCQLPRHFSVKVRVYLVVVFFLLFRFLPHGFNFFFLAILSLILDVGLFFIVILCVAQLLTSGQVLRHR